MAVGVPDVSSDLCLCEARLEPGPRIEPALHAPTREHRIGWLVKRMFHRLNRSYGVGVQMNRSGRAVLCLCQLNRSAVEMHL